MCVPNDTELSAAAYTDTDTDTDTDTATDPDPDRQTDTPVVKLFRIRGELKAEEQALFVVLVRLGVRQIFCDRSTGG